MTKTSLNLTAAVVAILVTFATFQQTVDVPAERAPGIAVVELA